jgi:alkaline phosphatase
VDAKGKVVPTVMELAKEAGCRTGNVSTSEITDATPACA